MSELIGEERVVAPTAAITTVAEESWWQGTAPNELISYSSYTCSVVT